MKHPHSEPARCSRRAMKALRALAGPAVLAAVLIVPVRADSCGWWGDGESSSDGEAVVIDLKGQETKARQARPDEQTPEALTRQANRLRRFGVSGYAGAARLYRQAAAAGFAPAQNNLGAMYEEGLGVAKDPSTAIQWYRRAAEQGEPHAQHSLGAMLLAGRGAAQDTDEGLQWIERAARQGHASACAQLGRLYAAGQHVARDRDQAVHWWREADRHGYPAAKQELEALTGPAPK